MGACIQEGADTFLFQEYKFCTVWCIFMAIIIWLAVDGIWSCYSAISFLVGAATSICCGYIAMKIAVKANFRTTYVAYMGIENNSDPT